MSAIFVKIALTLRDRTKPGPSCHPCAFVLQPKSRLMQLIRPSRPVSHLTSSWNSG